MDCLILAICIHCEKVYRPAKIYIYLNIANQRPALLFEFNTRTMPDCLDVLKLYISVHYSNRNRQIALNSCILLVLMCCIDAF